MSKSDSVLSSMQMALEEYFKSTVKTSDTEIKEFFSTGNELLDMLLGKGVPIGSMVLLVGDPGTFKSTIAGNICAALKSKYPEALVVYVDTENSTTSLRLKQLGIDNVVPKTGLSVEKVFSLIQALMMFKEEKNLQHVPSIVVWDSIANTPTEQELTSNSINETIGLKPRIISVKLPVIVNNLSKYNITLLFINQLREKLQIGPMSVGSDLKHITYGKTMPGGNSIKFNASQLLELKLTKSLDHNNSPYGCRISYVKIKTVKNKFFPDGYDFEFVVNPLFGLDRLLTLWEFLKSQKRAYSGAWCYLKDYPSKKFHQKDLHKIYNEDQSFREAFDKIANETIDAVRNKICNYSDIDATEDADDQSDIHEDNNVQDSKEMTEPPSDVDSMLSELDDVSTSYQVDDENIN